MVIPLPNEYSKSTVLNYPHDTTPSRKVRKAQYKGPKIKRTHYFRNFLISLLVILFIVINGIGLYVGNLIYTETSIRHAHLNEENLEKFEAVMADGKANKNWQDVAIQSADGYSLKGTFVPNPEATDKTVIFLHGFGENRMSGVNYLPMYLREGFNVLLIDQRAQGNSGGNSITWGKYEKKDLDQWITWLKAKYPDGQIGIHGVSMGAVVALLHAGTNESQKRVAFYIADSPYTNLQNVIADQVEKRYGLHGRSEDILMQIVLAYANIVAYVNGCFTYSESAPINIVSSVSTPVLYIHGQNDKLIPYQMSEQLYTATEGPKEIYLFPQTGHVSSIYKSPRKYGAIVHNFINNVDTQWHTY